MGRLSQGVNNRKSRKNKHHPTSLRDRVPSPSPVLSTTNTGTFYTLLDIFTMMRPTRQIYSIGFNNLIGKNQMDIVGGCNGFLIVKDSPSPNKNIGCKNVYELC